MLNTGSYDARILALKVTNRCYTTCSFAVAGIGDSHLNHWVKNIEGEIGDRILLEIPMVDHPVTQNSVDFKRHWSFQFLVQTQTHHRQCNHSPCGYYSSLVFVTPGTEIPGNTQVMLISIWEIKSFVGFFFVHIYFNWKGYDEAPAQVVAESEGFVIFCLNLWSRVFRKIISIEFWWSSKNSWWW